MCARHQKTQTTRCMHVRHRRTPTTSSETTARSKGSDIFSLNSSLALSQAFLAHKGNVTSLSTCYIWWLCEIRHCVIESFGKSVSVSSPTALEVMLRSCRIIFCNSTAIPSKVLFSVEPLGHCYDSQYHAEDFKKITFPYSLQVGQNKDEWWIPLF